MTSLRSSDLARPSKDTLDRPYSVLRPIWVMTLTDRFLYQKWCYDGVVGLERSQIFRATTFREMEFPFLA